MIISCWPKKRSGDNLYFDSPLSNLLCSAYFGRFCFSTCFLRFGVVCSLCRRFCHTWHCPCICPCTFRIFSLWVKMIKRIDLGKISSPTIRLGNNGKENWPCSRKMLLSKSHRAKEISTLQMHKPIGFHREQKKNTEEDRSPDKPNVFIKHCLTPIDQGLIRK